MYPLNAHQATALGDTEQGICTEGPGRLGGAGRVTASLHRTTIWTHRVRFLEERALPHWATFTIWNAGKQGRRLYRSLTAGSRHKVGAPVAWYPHPLRPPHPQQHCPRLASCVLPRWLPFVT